MDTIAEWKRNGRQRILPAPLEPEGFGQRNQSSQRNARESFTGAQIQQCRIDAIQPDGIESAREIGSQDSGAFDYDQSAPVAEAQRFADRIGRIATGSTGRTGPIGAGGRKRQSRASGGHIQPAS